jgi:hypothetical protein
MRTIIYITVYAKDSESALDAAHDVVVEKLGYANEGGVFDYYADFTKVWNNEFNLLSTEEDLASSLKANDYIGLDSFDECDKIPLPPVLQVRNARFPIDDKRGLYMVNFAMNNNRRTFELKLAQIQQLVADYTADQLFDYVERMGSLGVDERAIKAGLPSFRYLCIEASGSFPGPGAYLYDFLGRTISSPERLRRILNDSDSNPWYFMQASDRGDPNWGPHIWTKPLWVVPYYVNF